MKKLYTFIVILAIAQSSIAQTTNYLSKFAPSSTFTNSIMYDNGTGIGIGTTSPSYKLDILGGAGETDFLNIAANGVPTTAGFVRITNATNIPATLAPVFWGKGNSTTHPGAWFLADILSGQDAGTVPLMRFEARANNTTVMTRPLFEWKNAATIHMTMLANGNVGMGTTSPESGFKLDVNGSTAVGTSGSARVYIGTTNSTLAYIQSRDNAVTRNLKFDASAYIFNSGNVGIGNTNPAYKLDILGAVGETNFLNIVGNGVPSTAGFIRITNATSRDSTLAPAFWGKGNVATVPGLWFLGDVLNGQDMGTVPLVRFEARANNATVTTRPLFEWKNASTTYMTMIANGNVGIGTKSPDNKLTINGTIHSTEVKVNTSIPIPDYVFDKDYSLLSLKKVQEYIDKNHHLPEVPSAAEISKNGLLLGEMNIILLKKVEELTLHLINKDKQLTDQQKKIDQQEARMILLEKALSKLTSNK